ncbi:hypothetical protein KCU98_g710, partial [Aureobasidium melanogenum]
MHSSILRQAIFVSIIIASSLTFAAPQVQNDIEGHLFEGKSALTNLTLPSEWDDFEEDDEFDEFDDFSFLDDIVDRPDLESRAGHGPNNPVDAHIDCTGIEELCDANCYAILCLNRPSLLQKVSQAIARRNRRQCGAKMQPFKGTVTQLRRRGLSRPDGSHVSAEEYPFASTQQGGSGADLFPARVSDQNIQRDAIRNMYKNYGVGVNDYFELKFDNANTPYCNALANGDYSVCSKQAKGPWGFDFGIFAFVRDSLKNQNLHFGSVGK